jgi:hypothetical protein
MKRVALLFLCCLFGLLTITAAAQMRGGDFVKNVIEVTAEKQGLKASEVWNKQWRIVILFNSANSASRSSYTLSSIEAITEFLSERRTDGKSHLVSFFPYQLDLYQDSSKALINVPLTADVVTRVERLVPRIPFKYLGDGVTPYPTRGGHDNFMARKQVSELLGPSKMPTLLLQFSDSVLSEAPGSDNDDSVRETDQRPKGAENLGVVFFPSATQVVPTGDPRQKYSISIYGPEQLSSSRGLDVKRLAVFALVSMGILGALFFLYKAIGGLSFGTAAKWRVELPGCASIVIGKGETVEVFSKGAQLPPGGNFAVFSQESFPSGKLFEMKWDKQGVRFASHLVKLSDSSGEASFVASSSLEVTAEDTTLSYPTRRLEIKISSVS